MALGMTVAELLNRISSRELSEWMAYAEVEPFGEERADLRSGIIASTVANTARDPKKRKQPYTADEFMPQFHTEQPEPKRATLEQQIAFLELFNVAFGGKDLRKA